MTRNFEDYVRGVYYLQEKSGYAKPVELAKRLHVSKNTVSLMVQKLSTQGLLKHRSYGAIGLTGNGRKIARALTYRHRLIELFLANVLGVSAARVHEEACRLEHDFSEASIRGIKKLLGDPTACPHGSPLHG